LSDLIALARESLAVRNWSIEGEARLAPSRLHFDLVAESDAAIVFIEAVDAHDLRARAKALSSEVAAVTLQETAGVKAWEAYLVLLITHGYTEAQAAAQELQRDLTYCRKIVVNGEAILGSAQPQKAMDTELSFLFPFDVAGAELQTEDVRSHLIDLITKAGVDGELVASLVNAFDSESDCRCWDRVMDAVAPSELGGNAG
jgi:hypothetical protein